MYRCGDPPSGVAGTGYIIFPGREKQLGTGFFGLRCHPEIHEKYPVLEVENIGEPDFVIRYVPDPEKSPCSI